MILTVGLWILVVVTSGDGVVIGDFVWSRLRKKIGDLGWFFFFFFPRRWWWWLWPMVKVVVVGAVDFF